MVDMFKLSQEIRVLLLLISLHGCGLIYDKISTCVILGLLFLHFLLLHNKFVLCSCSLFLFLPICNLVLESLVQFVDHVPELIVRRFHASLQPVDIYLVFGLSSWCFWYSRILWLCSSRICLCSSRILKKSFLLLGHNYSICTW